MLLSSLKTILTKLIGRIVASSPLAQKIMFFGSLLVLRTRPISLLIITPTLGGTYSTGPISSGVSLKEILAFNRLAKQLLPNGPIRYTLRRDLFQSKEATFIWDGTLDLPQLVRFPK